MRTRALWRFAIAALFVLGFGQSDAATGNRDISVAGDRRVALVIGNSDYTYAGRLANPRNDAKAIAESLNKLGFNVELGLDLTRSQTDDVLRRFGNRLEGATVSVFYYAGHGFQLNGLNYIVPIDAQLKNERDIDFEVVNMQKLLNQLEAVRRVNLIFLDACRDNPLAQTLARSMAAKGRSVGMTRGLAPVDAAAGTLISYATKDGTVASDGRGTHSPYTAAILQEINTPGLEVGLMLRRVRERVMKETNEQQVPWDYGSLLGEFYFAGAPAAPLTPVAAATGVLKDTAQAVSALSLPKGPSTAAVRPTVTAYAPNDRTERIAPSLKESASVVFLRSTRGIEAPGHLVFGPSEDALTKAIKRSGFANVVMGSAADGKVLADTGKIRNSLANQRYVFLVSLSATDQGTHPLNDKIHSFAGVTSLRVFDTSRKEFVYDASTKGNRVNHSQEVGAAEAVSVAANNLTQEIEAFATRLGQ